MLFSMKANGMQAFLNQEPLSFFSILALRVDRNSIMVRNQLKALRFLFFAINF